MNNPVYKKGDKIICIKEKYGNWGKLGEIYTVYQNSDSNDSFIYFEAKKSMSKDRIRLATQQEINQGSELTYEVF